jgi:hypothetical protein
MHYQDSNSADATSTQGTRDAVRTEWMLIDAEFDDFPDSEFAAIRDSLIDVRHV